MSELAPLLLLILGMISVLGLIIGLKLNAFLALLISAVIVSLGVGLVQDVDAGTRMGAVVSAFGSTAGAIGIVIAMAAIIGRCMLDSGAADRVVQAAVALTGERRAAAGLMGSGFVLAVPVFFDTVFFLLVPLARSLHRRTGKHYLRYLMAIATGGAITHTLVPPTPGPLLVASILGVDLGMMILVGILVAAPAALMGLAFSIFVDAKRPIEMRPLTADEQTQTPLSPDRLPSLGVALLPVLLPVVLIGAGTAASTIADREDRARLDVTDIRDYAALSELLANAPEQSPAGRIIGSSRMDESMRATLTTTPTDDVSRQRFVDVFNEVLLDPNLYDKRAFLGVLISPTAEQGLSSDQLRMKPVDRRRMNRQLVEDALPELIEPHRWDSPARRWATWLSLPGNANFALLVAALVAMLTLKRVRGLSFTSLGESVESALMSGGLIILITAAGGAFGGMLQQTQISVAIRDFFTGSAASGIGLLLLGWGIAAVLKVAQGSSTVAMIVGAGMMSAIIGDAQPNYNLVYVAAAVGSGSLMGSWMNDSGFWVFTKMGGLTESESLRSWTPLLATLATTGLIATILLSLILPLAE